MVYDLYCLISFPYNCKVSTHNAHQWMNGFYCRSQSDDQKAMAPPVWIDDEDTETARQTIVLRVPVDDTQPVCAICQEKWDQVWDHDQDKWMCMAAIRVPALTRLVKSAEPIPSVEDRKDRKDSTLEQKAYLDKYQELIASSTRVPQLMTLQNKVCHVACVDAITFDCQ